MDDAAANDLMKTALHKIEDAYHDMMRSLLDGDANDIEVTAALLAVAQNAAAFGIGRIIQAKGATVLPRIANPFLQKALQTACDLAGVKARVVLETGEPDVRVH